MSQMSPYDAKDILKKLQKHKRLSKGIEKFFHYDSLFFKALRKYIQQCKTGHCPFIDMSYRSTLRWKSSCANPIGAGINADNVIRIYFEATICDNGYNQNRVASSTIDVPHDIITAFTQDKFDEWALNEQTKFNETRLRIGKAKLEEIFQQYPELRKNNAN